MCQLKLGYIRVCSYNIIRSTVNWTPMEGPLLRREFCPQVPGFPGQRFLVQGGGCNGGGEVLPLAHVLCSLSVPMGLREDHCPSPESPSYYYTGCDSPIPQESQWGRKAEHHSLAMSFKESPMQTGQASSYIPFWAASPKLSSTFKEFFDLPEN